MTSCDCVLQQFKCPQSREVEMLWRRGVLILTIAVCACVLGGHVFAQNSLSCYTAYQFCALCGDPPIPGATCYVEMTILSICIVPVCPPAASPAENCPTCDALRGAQTPNGAAGSPINLATGNTYIKQ